MNPKVRPLTPRQETDASLEAYDAFARDYEAQHPAPEARVADIVHTNPKVAKTLVTLMGLLPLMLLLMALAAIFISTEKTMLAFYNASPHKHSLGGLVGAVVMACACIMIEGANLYAEFAIVHEMLLKALPRRKTTLPTLLEGCWVFLGYQPVREKVTVNRRGQMKTRTRLTWRRIFPYGYDQIANPDLLRFRQMVFFFALVASIYGGMSATINSGKPWSAYGLLEKLDVGIAIGLGVVGTFCLRFIGAQLAQFAYRQMEWQQYQAERIQQTTYREELNRHWKEVEAEWVARARHRKFLMVNRLPLDTDSPYLLVAGRNDEGEDEVQSLPFEN